MPADKNSLASPRLLAIDPGVSTGLALFDLSHPGQLVAYSEVRLFKGIDRVIDLHSVTFVVCERVTVNPRGFNPEPLKVMGVIEYLCEERGIEMRYQSPSVMKGPRRWPGVKSGLKKIRSQHVRDAVCHGMAYMKATQLEVGNG